ncbi:uncharacterized protein LOC120670351 [Panicum virgatum]|uniref:Uncharacterized protein n=1 Tax=Panicum virgatum TaxID=38727 RepID=A0A8T0SZE1_PANVG|nr:uncharacterized protein LOC120670351 [Panicum virgatum]KAG2604882.1 hypothetical protein PVAP13_4NG111000 [Panicum virgatum]
MADDRIRMAIVLGVGAAAAGGPEAVRLLLAVAAGRSTAADVAACVLLICAFTALILGNLLLARFFRDAPRNAGAAPGTQLFAKMTAAVALASMFFVTACLLAIPSIPSGRGNAGGGAERSCRA